MDTRNTHGTTNGRIDFTRQIYISNGDVHGLISGLTLLG